MIDTPITSPTTASELERELTVVQSDIDEMDALESDQAEVDGGIDPQAIAALDTSEFEALFPHGIGPHNVPHNLDYAVAITLRRNLIGQARAAGISEHRIADALGVGLSDLPSHA